MESNEESEENKVIPLPKENEILTLLGDNNEIKGYLSGKRPRYLPKGVRYMLTFQDGFDWLWKQGLTGRQWNILAKLFSKLDYDNYLKISQAEMAKEMGIDKADISRTLKKFCQLNILFVGPLAGHSKTYRLNPYLAHKGAKGYANTIIDFTKAKEEREAKEQANTNNGVEKINISPEYKEYMSKVAEAEKEFEEKRLKLLDEYRQHEAEKNKK